MEYIKFKEQIFPVVNLNFNDCCCKISNIKLNSVLLDEQGNYVSEEARKIDENIFYFTLEKNLLLEESSLINLLKKEII